MKYVSVEMVRYAAGIMAAVERFEAEHPEEPGGGLRCSWQAGPDARPCHRDAEYFVQDGTRVSAGGDIEAAPLWFCREHLELELGEPVREQPIFRHVEGPEDFPPPH